MGVMKTKAEKGRKYKEILAGADALFDRTADAFTCPSFVIVLLHGRRVDTPETSLDGLVDEVGCPLFLPRGSVHHGGHLCRRLRVCHGVAGRRDVEGLAGSVASSEGLAGSALTILGLCAGRDEN